MRKKLFFGFREESFFENALFRVSIEVDEIGLFEFMTGPENYSTPDASSPL